MINIKENELYKANLDDLLYQKHQTATLLYQINHSHPEKRIEIHKSLFPSLFNKLGENSWLETPFNCDYGKNISIGSNCYFNHHISIGDGAQVQIGDNVIIGPYVGIYTAEHPLDPHLRKEGWQSASPITIGNNVWIGANVTILSGITIGDNAVIGAGSIVTKDIPSNALAYGNPARVIKILS